MKNRITWARVQDMFETLRGSARRAGVDTTGWAVDNRGTGYLLGRLGDQPDVKPQHRHVSDVFARFDGPTALYEYMAAMHAAFGMVLSMPITPRPNPADPATHSN